MNQLNPIHIITDCLANINFNIILLTVLRSFLLKFSLKTSVTVPNVPSILATHTFVPSFSRQPKIVWCSPQPLNLHNIQLLPPFFSLSLSVYLSPKTNCFPFYSSHSVTGPVLKNTHKASCVQFTLSYLHFLLKENCISFFSGI